MVIFWRITEDEQREGGAGPAAVRRRRDRAPAVHLRHAGQPGPAQPEHALPPAGHHQPARGVRSRTPTRSPTCSSSTTSPPGCGATPRACWCSPGEQPPRIWSEPVPLRDVVRAAIAETEDLDRVGVRRRRAASRSPARRHRPDPPARRAHRERRALLAAGHRGHDPGAARPARRRAAAAHRRGLGRRDAARATWPTPTQLLAHPREIDLPVVAAAGLPRGRPARAAARDHGVAQRHPGVRASRRSSSLPAALFAQPPPGRSRRCRARPRSTPCGRSPPHRHDTSAARRSRRRRRQVATPDGAWLRRSGRLRARTARRGPTAGPAAGGTPRRTRAPTPRRGSDRPAARSGPRIRGQRARRQRARRERHGATDRTASGDGHGSERPRVQRPRRQRRGRTATPPTAGDGRKTSAHAASRIAADGRAPTADVETRGAGDGRRPAAGPPAPANRRAEPATGRVPRRRSRHRAFPATPRRARRPERASPRAPGADRVRHEVAVGIQVARPAVARMPAPWTLRPGRRPAGGPATGRRRAAAHRRAPQPPQTDRRADRLPARRAGQRAAPAGAAGAPGARAAPAVRRPSRAAPRRPSAAAAASALSRYQASRQAAQAVVDGESGAPAAAEERVTARDRASWTGCSSSSPATPPASLHASWSPADGLRLATSPGIDDALGDQLVGRRVRAGQPGPRHGAPARRRAGDPDHPGDGRRLPVRHPISQGATLAVHADRQLRHRHGRLRDDDARLPRRATR